MVNSKQQIKTLSKLNNCFESTNTLFGKETISQLSNLDGQTTQMRH